MRCWLPAFLLVCIGAGGWFAWRIAAGVVGGGEPVATASPAVRPQPSRDRQGAGPQPVATRHEKDDSAARTSPRPVHGEGERPARGAEVEPVDAAPAPAATAAVHWPVSAPEQRAAMQALDTTERALALDPDHPEALRDKAAALRRLDRPGEAADTLAHLVRLLPDSAADRLEYGSLLAEQSRWQAALEQFAALASLLPDDARAWHNLAVAHQALGHLRDAREAWDRVMAISPDAAAYAHRAEVAADMGDWQSAAADYEAARALDPTDVDFGVNLAWARGRLGRDAEARELLLELLKAHPSHVPIMNRLAELAWRRALAAPAGEQAAAREAAEWCRRSLRVDSRQPEVEALLAQAVAASDDSH